MSNIGVNSILSIYWEGETAWYTAKVIEKHPINFDKIRIHYLDDDMVEWASIVKMQSEGLKIIELVAPITDMERLKQRVLSSKRDRSPSKKVMESISQASPKRTKRPTASSSFSSSSTTSTTSTTSATSTTVYASGDLVEGNFKGLNTWYQCRILNIHSNTPLSYDLKYVEDGIIESNVPQAFIRPTKQQTTKASITKNVKQQPNLQFSFRYKSSVMVLPGRFSEDDRVILKHWWQQYSDKREKKYDSRTVESKSKKSNIGSAPNMSRLEESTLLTQQEIFDKFHQKLSAFTPILSTEKVSRSNYDDDNNDNINDNNDMSDDKKNSGRWSQQDNRAFENIKSTSTSSPFSSSLQTAVSSSNSSTVQKNVGRWTQQEKRAFEEGLKHHGRGRWKLFLPLIPTKSQLQIRQVSFPPPCVYHQSHIFFFLFKTTNPNQPLPSAFSFLFSFYSMPMPSLKAVVSKR